MNTGIRLLSVLFSLVAVCWLKADWAVATFRTGERVHNLAAADALIATSQPIATGSILMADFVGFDSGEGTGHFGINNPVPGISQVVATDNYAVRAVGILLIPNSGTYTFGLNTDDGARLRLDGADVIIDDVRSPPHDSAYRSVVLNAGQYVIEWTWYNTEGGSFGGGACAELFAVADSASAFDPAFTLVGDPTGLRVQVPEPSTTILAVFGVSVAIMGGFRLHRGTTAEQVTRENAGLARGL